MGPPLPYCYPRRTELEKTTAVEVGFSVIYTGIFTEQSVSCCGMIISSDKGAIWQTDTKHTPPVSAQLCRGVEPRVNAAVISVASPLCAGSRSAGHMVGLRQDRRRHKAGSAALMQGRSTGVRGALRDNDAQRSSRNCVRSRSL
jgi:hypothetical protein